jgi:predicted Zn-dependent peptidase
MFEMEDGRDTFELYAEAGADANAYTGFDRTAYLFSCTDRFEDNLRILIKMVTEPYFTEETVKKEQGIIGEEIKMCEDRAWDAAYFGLMRALYKENPVRIPVAGTVESIAKITPELLYRCHKTFYDLKNMALCVCGRVDEDRVIAIADEMLSEADGGEIERFMPEEAAEVFKSREIVRMQVSKPMFSIGVKDTMICDGDFCRFEAMRSLSSEALFGMSSELYSELYESGTVGGYGSSWAAESGASTLSICGDCDDPEAVYEKFVEYAERCVRNGISDEAFVRAKRVLYSRAIRAFESTADITEELFNGFITGADIFEMAEAINRVEKSELEELIRSVLKPEHYAMCMVLPNDK